MNNFLIKSSAIVGAAILISNLHADEEGPVYQLENYLVSVGPIARPLSDYASPVTSLDGDAIQRSNAGTLGQLLEGQPGVASTSFGGGASRPIIRGFDGPRVRILESGLGSQDVSETSPDHAVAVEPLLIDRVEVLRGPSTLLYGSSAIGGVVNVMGKEIPRQPVDPKGYEGALESRYDTVSDGETYLGYGTVGGENWALRVTGLSRESDNYEIPGDAEIHHDDGHEEESGDKLSDSFVENDYVSIGGTWFFGEQNYIGASFSVLESYYGVSGHMHHEEAHDEKEGEEEEHHEAHSEGGVAIDLERQRFDLELALFDVTDWIEAARVRFAYTDYEHSELEFGEEETHEEWAEAEMHGHEPTSFSRESWELRAEASHGDLGFIDEGLLGINISDKDFEVEGEEGAAFGPATNTRSQAIFVSEHVHQGDWHYEFGGRVEAQQINVEGTASDYSDVALSLAAGIIYNIDELNSLALSIQRSERHPVSSELYANGEHLATRQFEVGDDDLGLETAYGLDLSYRHRSERWESSVSVFYVYFDDYILAEAAGDEISDLPVYAYGAVDATFWGLEAELEHLLIDENGFKVRVAILGDFVNAENRDTGDHLPRIPPVRIGGKLRVGYGDWDAGLLVRHAFSQNDTNPLETDTDSYTELKLDLGYTFELGNGVDLTVFARAENLLDEEIRHHTSFLKDLAPLPGRNFTLGARLEF